MGFLDWILKGVGVESEEVPANEAGGLQEDVKVKHKHEKKQKKIKQEESQQMTFGNYNDQRNSFSSDKDQFNTNSVYYNSYEKPQPEQTNMVNGYGTKNVVIYYPKDYADVQNLIDYLKQGESAVMNLDGIVDSEAQRILDFVSGAVYALSGSVHRISGNIFMLTPEGYNIMVPKDNK